jgi:acyl carrier protein
MVGRDIASDVRRVVGRQLDVEDARVSPSASFTEDLGADSLGLIELTLALEEEFDIDITDEDAARIRTVQDAIRFVEQHASGTGADSE